MNNYLKNIKNTEILIVILVYLVFFSIGLLSFKDFGVSMDDWESSFSLQYPLKFQSQDM